VIRTLGFLMIVLLAAAVLLLLTIVLRRVVLSRRERRYAAAELRVRPLAIALVEGETVELPALATADQAVLADVLGRYSRALSGEGVARIQPAYNIATGLRSSSHDARSIAPTATVFA
jgi:uncharacterized SAM-binding protein YcdF (DUF218 family)